jgi:general secretion pathway protein K
VAIRRGNPRERGVVLLLVLWVFMTLGVLALDFSSYMRDDAMATSNLSDETHGYYLALAGMNRALYENNRQRQEHTLPNGQPAPVDPDEEANDADGDGKPDTIEFRPDGEWHQGTFGGGTFAVRMSGEDGKIPLNVEFNGEEKGLYQELIRFVVTNLVRGGNQTTGVDKDTSAQIDQIVDSIIDWRDCDKDAMPNGAEDDYYLGLARPHRAKNGFFDSPDELMQVRGVTPEVFYGHDDSPGFVDVFSPYPRGKELIINAGQITAQVVRALVPSMTISDAQDFVAGRGEDPEGIKSFLQQELDATVPGLGSRVQIVEPEFVRVEARADLAHERNQSSVMAIVQLGSNESDLPLILSWLDRAPLAKDGPGAAAPAADGPTKTAAGPS